MKRRTLLLFILVVALAAAMAVAVGQDKVWGFLAGPADQGAVDFAAIARPTTPNTYLVCPDELCGAAAADAVAPVFAVSVESLRDAAFVAWRDELRLEQVAVTDDGNQIRLVQYTALMRFPDTISVRFIALGDDRSTLALYSRSLVGYSDLGANEARATRWLDRLVDLPRG